MSSECEVHRELFLALCPRASYSIPHSSQCHIEELNHTLELNHIEVLNNHTKELTLLRDRSSPSVWILGLPGPYLHKLLLTVFNNHSNDGYGQIINRQWIDLSLLLHWKSTCDSLHGKQCHASRRGPQHASYRPVLLIDTWLMRLKYTSPGDQYVALSYVWGNCKALKTTNANLQSLLKDQALSSSIIAYKIPQTLTDAIKLLGLIRGRFLWVDSLCIVQDDTDSFQQQLNSMTAIYANAQLTIVAADGDDATYGLRGIKGVSQPRSSPQSSFTLSKDYKIIWTSQYTFGLTSAWDQRGWTFQEDIFSRRRLIFCDNMISWECPTCTVRINMFLFSFMEAIRHVNHLSRAFWSLRRSRAYLFSCLRILKE